MAKFIVTIAPPTPNGNLHLGHISGPFLAADIFARLRRLKGDDVFFTSYSDDYQDYVARKALQLDRNKFDVAQEFGTKIDNTLQQIDIQVDWFMKSFNNRYYKDAIVDLYKAAMKNGAIKQVKAQVPYSEEEDQYGYEAFARGLCNYCGEESDASQCESCAKSPVMDKMGDLKSVFTNKPMSKVEKNREYLSIDKYRDYLKTLHTGNPARPYLKAYIDQVLELEDLNWFIDRPGGHGIDLRIEGKDITIHTWFSGLAGYLGASKEFFTKIGKPERHDEFWKDSETKVVNFLGFDCSFSHAIVYPSLALNAEGITKNHVQLTNKFLKLEGGDFSTSRNHAIWVDDILKDYSVDGVRFYLALISPEEELKNFEMEKFSHWYNEFFQPLISLVKKVIGDYISSGKSMQQAGPASMDEKIMEAYRRWQSFTELENFSISGMAAITQETLNLVQNMAEAGNTAGAAQAAMAYLVLSEPIHPTLSQKLLRRYTISEDAVLNQLTKDTEENVPT